MKVQVFALPQLLAGHATETAAAVVIDALRMTTTAAVAMEHGCSALMAVAEVEEARALAKQAGALLGGERMALLIEGFDFTNSPLEYTAARIQGKKLVMSTTNGTRAVLMASGLRRVLLGAFVNAKYVARAVRDEAELALVCAGTVGAFTLEDALAAGAILHRLRDEGVSLAPDDMAIAAMTLYAQAKDDLHTALSRASHYGRLASLGLREDLDFCLQCDVIEAVPQREADGWFTRYVSS